MYYGKKENSISNGCSICSGTAFGDDCNHSTGIHHHRCGQHR